MTMPAPAIIEPAYTHVEVVRDPSTGRIVVHIPGGQTVTYASLPPVVTHIAVTYENGRWQAPYLAEGFQAAAEVVVAAEYGEIIPR
jgi:hypothetical protein